MGHPALAAGRSGPRGPAPPAPQAVVPGPGSNHRRGSPSAIRSQTPAGAWLGGHPAVGLRAPARAAGGEGPAQGTGQPLQRHRQCRRPPPGGSRNVGPGGAGTRPTEHPQPSKAWRPGGGPESSSSSSSHGLAPAPTSSDAGTRWWGLPRATRHTSHPHPPPDGLKATLCGGALMGPRGWLGAHGRDQREVRF